MNKLAIWKMKAMTHNVCHFPSLVGKEIDCELQTVIVDHLFYLHDNFHAHFLGSSSAVHTTFCQYPSLAKQRRSLYLNDNSEVRLRQSDLQPRISTLVNRQPYGLDKEHVHVEMLNVYE